MNKSVCDNLAETRKNLLKEINLLSAAQFNRKPDLNQWSIAQVCHHLVLVEESSIKAIAWGLRETNSTQKERKDIQLLLLDRTKKIKAPIIVEPNVEPFNIQEIVDLLNDSREKLLAFLSTIDDTSILAEKSVKHPALGDLPLDQWIEQIYVHEQRHIEQIKEIKSLLDARQ